MCGKGLLINCESKAVSDIIMISNKKRICIE
jgi:hypothetical protein